MKIDDVLKGKPKEKDDDDDEDDVLKVGSDLVKAAKAIRAASGAKEYAKALKGFIKLCEEDY